MSYLDDPRLSAGSLFQVSFREILGLLLSARASADLRPVNFENNQCPESPDNSKNSQEPGVLSDINISLRNTCNFRYVVSARESIFSQPCSAYDPTIGDYTRLTRRRHSGGDGITGFVLSAFVRVRPRLWTSYVIGIGAPGRNEVGGSK
jgi:hypothetical protein